MPTLTRLPLSGSTNGRGILITGTTATDGTTLHTAATGSAAGDVDDITLQAYNSATETQTVVIAWGGTTLVNDIWKADLPVGFCGALSPGSMFLRAGLVIKAGATTASKVTVFGSVIRATQ